MKRYSEIQELLKEAFLKNLRNARKKAGLSQKEAADRMGKPQSFIAKIESGERKLSPIEIFLLSKIYNVEVGAFFEGMGEVWEREKKKK